MDFLLEYAKKIWKRLFICAAVGIMIICLWLSPLHYISISEKGYLMNYYSWAFVFFILLNIIALVINFIAKFAQLIFKVSVTKRFDWFLHFLTLLGGGPGNMLSMVLFWSKIFDPVYHYYYTLSAFSHMVLFYFAYHATLVFG